MIQIIKIEHNVLIQEVEILKMASKMAVNQFPKTCLSNILDKNRFYFFIFMDVYRINDTND